MIQRKNGKFYVYSKEGKPFGIYTTRAEAVKRIQQMEYFKHRGK